MFFWKVFLRFSHESYSISLQPVVLSWESSILNEHTLLQRCKKHRFRPQVYWISLYKRPRKIMKKLVRFFERLSCLADLGFKKNAIHSWDVPAQTNFAACEASLSSSGVGPFSSFHQAAGPPGNTATTLRPARVGVWVISYAFYCTMLCHGSETMFEVSHL